MRLRRRVKFKGFRVAWVYRVQPDVQYRYAIQLLDSGRVVWRMVLTWGDDWIC